MAKKCILITGATGLIGFRTLLVALRAGYTARVAIRKPEQEEKIRQAPSLAAYSSDVSFSLVPDMASPGAYDAAVRGADYIMHIANPIPMSLDTQRQLSEGKSWQEAFYKPAINGTLEVLRAASRTSSVERVVITASGNVLASLYHEPGATHNSIRTCPSMEQANAVQDAHQAYGMSKILQLTAAQRFMTDEKPDFDVVYVCPGYVQGSHEMSQSVDEFSRTTSEATINVARGKKLGAPPLAPPVNCQIWVEDVARAHVESLNPTKIEGGDVLVLAGDLQNSAGWAAVGSMIREWYPQEVEAGKLNPLVEQETFNLTFSGVETEKKLGWKYSGPDVWAREVVDQYLQMC